MRLVATTYSRVIEPFAAFGAESRERTVQALRAARIRLAPEIYLTLSYVWASCLGVFALGAMLVVLWGNPGAPWALAALLALCAGVLAFALTRLGFLLYPRVVASSRARAIDAEFASVVMLCSALARGGVAMVEVFRAVAEEREAYGEISVEFAQILREIDLTGKDLNSAIQSVSAQTPSQTLRGFLDGLVTILNSGADPRDYLKRQSAALLAGSSLALDKEIEQAGLLAEAYVSGLLVLPLLLIVVLTVLSVLSGGGSAMVVLIVFVFIPGGTAAYLILAETMMPAPTLVVPRAKTEPLVDFGVGTLPRELLVLPPPRAATLDDVAADLKREGADMTRVRRWLVVEWARRRSGAALRALKTGALQRPASILVASGAAAAVVLASGALLVLARGVAGPALTVGMTTVALAAAAVAVVPVAVFHEMRVKRSRGIDSQFPDVLGRLAGFNEKGVSLLKSFEILGGSTSGALGRHLRGVKRDVSWTANLKGAIVRLRDRVSTRRMTKLGVLFERGIGATGNLKEVLEVAAADASVQESQAARKRQAMMSYVVVVYVVFAVFLYVIYMVVDLFYGPSGFATAATTAGQVKGLHTGLPAVQARGLFFFASLLQGLCCGLVAGKLGEGHILSGVKHAALMGVGAWALFVFAVF